MPRKLAILAPLKSWGGIERKMVTLCREFVELGVQIDFLLTRGGVVPYPDEFPSEVTVIDLGQHGKLATLPRLSKYLRKSRPDALLTAKDHAAITAVLANRLGRMGIPVFVKVTNTLSQTLRRPAKRLGARYVYPLAEKIIAVSQGVKDDLTTNFGTAPDKVEVIYNPTVTPDILARAGAAPPHKWLTGGEPPVVLGVGRLTPQKDFVTLINAFSLLRQRQRCRLIILGEGAERERLEAHAHDLGVASDVALPGYVPDPLPWMAHASVFVLSSRYEGLPNALIEALAAGTPVVSTNCPSGANEILAGGRYGALVPVGNAEHLTTAISETLSTPPDAASLREALIRFDSRAVAKQYLQTMGLMKDAS